MAALGAAWGRSLGPALGLLLTTALFAAVPSAIHHAEVVERRAGTMVLGSYHVDQQVRAAGVAVPQAAPQI